MRSQPSQTRSPVAVPRRGFLSRAVAALTGILAVGAAPDLASAGGRPSRRTGETTQDSWLDRLGAKHGQFFDSPVLAGGKVLQQVRNYYDAYRDAYGLPAAEIDAVVGVHGSTVPIVFQDRVWERFGFGERFQVEDPGTRAAAKRNVFARGLPTDAIAADASVAALQERGVILLLCNNSLKRVVGTLSQAGFGTPEAVRRELIDGLLPGVEVVPAMVVAANLAQEKGLSYVYSG